MLDVGREEIDPVTGGKKVYVKVNGYILDLRKKFAVKVCSAGPISLADWAQTLPSPKQMP